MTEYDLKVWVHTRDESLTYEWPPPNFRTKNMFLDFKTLLEEKYKSERLLEISHPIEDLLKSDIHSWPEFGGYKHNNWFSEVTIMWSKECLNG